MKQKTLQNLLKENNFNFVSDYATDEYIKDPERKITDVKAVNFGRTITTKDAIQEMKEQGYVPVTITELLEWTKDNPDEKGWFVALGTTFTDSGGDLRVFRVGHVDDARWLHSLGGFPYYFWDADDQFVFCKVASDTGTLGTLDKKYDNFIREALAVGFTDDQVNFLEKWVYEKNKKLKAIGCNEICHHIFSPRLRKSEMEGGIIGEISQ